MVSLKDVRERCEGQDIIIGGQGGHVSIGVEQAMSFAASLKGADAAAVAKAQQELIGKAFESGLANARELAETVQRSNTEAYQTIDKRVKDSIEELKISTQSKF